MRLRSPAHFQVVVDFTKMVAEDSQAQKALNRRRLAQTSPQEDPPEVGPASSDQSQPEYAPREGQNRFTGQRRGFFRLFILAEQSLYPVVVVPRCIEGFHQCPVIR